MARRARRVALAIGGRMNGRNRLALALGALMCAPAAFADITDVGDTTSLGVGVTSRTPDEPAGILEGDFRLGVCSTTGVTNGTWSATGWQKLTEVAATTGTARDVAIFYSFRGSSAGNLTFSYSGSSATARCSMQVFRGVDPDVPFDVTYVQDDHFSDNNNGANVAHEPITTVTDGAWVVLVQVRSGDTATGSAAPSGYAMIMDYIGNNPEMNIAYKAMPSAGLETPGAWGHTGAEFAESANFTLALRPAPPPPPPGPEFLADPALDEAQEDGATFTFTADSAGDTIFGRLRHPTAAAWTCEALAEGTPQDGVVSKQTVSGADELFVPAIQDPEFPVYSADFCIVDGDGNESDVKSVTDVELPAPGGFQWVELAAVGMGSPCDVFNTATDPDIAANDWLLAPLETTPGGGGDFELTIDAQCHFTYVGDGTRQDAIVLVHDWTAASWHLDHIWFIDNNTAPTCAYSGELVTLLLSEPRQVDFGGVCADLVDEDPITFATEDQLPDGCTLSAAGLLDCEPTTEDHAGSVITIEACDDALDCDDFEVTVYVLGTVEMPALVGLELEGEGGALDALVAAMPWRTGGEIDVTYVCEPLAMDGVVTAQIPDANESMGPFDPISLEVADSTLCKGGSRRRKLLLGGYL